VVQSLAAGVAAMALILDGVVVFNHHGVAENQQQPPAGSSW